MPRVTPPQPKKTRGQPRASAGTVRKDSPAHSDEDRSHFLEAQEESGRQMRAFIQEHYGEAE
jgi:hypothetical protein